MSLNVNFWRLGSKAVRVVSADTALDEPIEGVPVGAMLFRTDLGAHRAFDGEAWASSGGGEQGPMRRVLMFSTWEHMNFDTFSGDRVALGALWRFR